VLPLAGKPVIAWTIEAALGVSRIDRLIVSTDDEEIARVAEDRGAEIPFRRPSALAQDRTPHLQVVEHAINWLRDNEGLRPDYLLTLQPTSPLRTAEDLEGVIRLAMERDAEAVVSVMETHIHPYLTRRLGDDGILTEFCSTDMAYLRRQDLPPAYFINGAAFLNRCDSLLGKRTFYPKNTYGYPMPPERSLQIDSPWDFHLAELILGERSGVRF
jgi:CMP-N-acetylneuraminic acid synthetase